MKKNIIYLGVLATLLFVLPLQASAVSFTDDDLHVSTEDISMGQFGTIEAGDFTWTYTDEEAGEKTWTISFDTDSSYIYFSLVPTDLTIEGVNVSGTGFVKRNQQNASDGAVDVLIESANSGTGRVTITVTTLDVPEGECMLNVSPLNLDCSVNIPGIYFDNNGNEITEEEYATICGNTVPDDEPDDPNDVPNSETGSVVPYIAIGGGLVAIVAVYLFARKSNKVYKI